MPEWLQSLGMIFSVMLLAPSWGGAINFVLTLRQGWDKLRSDPIPKFMAAATTFYMMATFEGPLLSIKSVSALAHNTDWVVGHVHSGALGWNGLLIFGMIYWLVPRLYNTTLYSTRLATAHFWMATAGIGLYIVSMWISGVTQGVMSISVNEQGLLRYPNYLEIVTSIIPLHAVRAVGGGLYLLGVFVLLYNVIKTVKSSKTGLVEGSTMAVDLKSPDKEPIAGAKDLKGYVWFQAIVERRTTVLAIGSLIAVAIGGIVQLGPIITQSPSDIALSTVTPYTPLEVAGRDIYIQEGCNNCHTQQVRPILGEIKRYGPQSLAGEFVNDTPHLWGSKRTGPDLARVGGKYSDVWHWKHMMEPQSLSQGSVMPPYPWLAKNILDFDTIKPKLKALKMIGINYSDTEIENAKESAGLQAQKISEGLSAQGEDAPYDRELIALIAYLQRLGIDGRAAQQSASTAP